MAADALSRINHLMVLQAVSEAQPLWLQEVFNNYITDSGAQELLTRLSVHSPDEQGYSLEKGLIKYKEKVWIAQNTALQTKIIVALHSTAIGGHSRIQATYHRVKRLFHWKGLKSDVEQFVKQCQICQQAKHSNTHPSGLLQPLPIPEGSWQEWTMDFIEGFPISEGYNSIFVVVDRYTKYAHFIPLKHPFIAHTLPRAVIDNVVKLHGLPRSIVSDKDRVFTSAFGRNCSLCLTLHYCEVQHITRKPMGNLSM